jgi:hypothetical protein
MGPDRTGDDEPFAVRVTRAGLHHVADGSLSTQRGYCTASSERPFQAGNRTFLFLRCDHAQWSAIRVPIVAAILGDPGWRRAPNPGGNHV